MIEQRSVNSIRITVPPLIKQMKISSYKTKFTMTTVPLQNCNRTVAELQPCRCRIATVRLKPNNEPFKIQFRKNILKLE